jgi:hypothetical protein
MRKRGDQSITPKDYIDARFEDLLIKHQGDFKSVQDEVDRRIDSMRREIDLRFLEASNRLDRMEELRDSKLKGIDGRLDGVEAIQDRQRGRIAAYATISGVLLIAVAVLTLVLDHVKF